MISGRSNRGRGSVVKAHFKERKDYADALKPLEIAAAKGPTGVATAIAGPGKNTPGKGQQATRALGPLTPNKNDEP